MRIRAAVAVGLLLIAAGLVVALADSERPYLGDNGRNIQLSAGVVIPGGERACQAGEIVPGHTGAVRLVVSTAGRQAGPLEVELRRSGQMIASGRSRARIVDEPVTVPMSGVAEAVPGTTFCLQNAGPGQVAILGQAAGSEYLPARVSDKRQPQTNSMRLEWYEGGRVTRAARVGDVAERYGLMKAGFFGDWTFWTGLGILVVISAAAIRWMVREVRT